MGVAPAGLGGAIGERMSPAAYREDFRKRDFVVDGYDSWELERGQVFQEPGGKSWSAFVRGDWAEALPVDRGRA